MFYSQVSLAEIMKSVNMKAIEILNGAGTAVACYEGVEDITHLSRLHPGYLMNITPKGLVAYGSQIADDNKPQEPHRFLVAKSQ